MLVPSESVCITIQIHFDVQQFPFLFKVFQPPPPQKKPKKTPKNAVTQQAIQQTAYEAPVSQFGNRSYAKGSRIA